MLYFLQNTFIELSLIHILTGEWTYGSDKSKVYRTNTQSGTTETLLSGEKMCIRDRFMAMQEIMFLLKSENTPESKLLSIEENLARTLSLDWNKFDLAKAVNY